LLLGFRRQGARRYGIRDGRSGCVTVIQRFGGALNLNIHFHTLLFDGVFNAPGGGDARVLSAATPDGCRGRRGAREDLSGVDGDAAFGSGRPIGTAI